MWVGWGSVTKQLFSSESCTSARRYSDVSDSFVSGEVSWPSLHSFKSGQAWILLALCYCISFPKYCNSGFSSYKRHSIDLNNSSIKEKSPLTNHAPMWPCITAPSIRVITHISDFYLPLLVLPTLASCYLSQSHPVLASLLHQSPVDFTNHQLHARIYSDLNGNMGKFVFQSRF